MKKNFLNFGLFLALGLTTAVFNSCEKDDVNDGGTNGGNGGNASKITATNVNNSSTQIKTVKALVYWGSGDEYDNDAIAQGPYQNNGFTLELPATLGAKYLETLDADDLEGITVSDRNFKSVSLDDLRGYNENDEEIGVFLKEVENDDSEHYALWLYVDRDVTIKGEETNYIDNGFEEEYEEEEIYDLTLKKGWNIVYGSVTGRYENGRDVHSLTMSSKKPSGVNYTWNFYDDYEISSPSVALKSAKNSKSFSSKLKGNKNK
ncbi:MAG: hypothetical protein RLZZ414_1525 [Bacteroidota bacterium]